jgi:hypothetical protein
MMVMMMAMTPSLKAAVFLSASAPLPCGGMWQL